MKSKRTISDMLALIVRITSIPPVMAAVMITLLFFYSDVFSTASEVVFAFFFLSVVPVAAYPCLYLLAGLTAKGREGQRDLAFILSAAGYAAAVVYGVFFTKNINLTVIYTLYLVSLLLLLLFNKVLRIRASGHACSVTGPVVLLVYFLGARSLLFGVIVYACIFWASLAVKRHTAGEFLAGSSISLISAVVSLFFIGA